MESLLLSTLKKKIYFLFSLREDYIGELWEWAHVYKLEDAWIHQYRIKRLDEKKAYEAIVQPLHKLGIKTDNNFILQLISELKKYPILEIISKDEDEDYRVKEEAKQGLAFS